MIWHNHTADEVLQELNTDREAGLSEETAQQRLAEYGENPAAGKAAGQPLAAFCAAAAGCHGADFAFGGGGFAGAVSV